MKFKNFEDSLAWQKGQELAVLLYKQFTSLSDFNFKNQLLKAVLSVSNNIAEGFERFHDKEFHQYLRIAKGSCSEVRSMLYLTPDLGYCTQKEADQYIDLSIQTSKLIQGLINYLNKKTT